MTDQLRINDRGELEWAEDDGVVQYMAEHARTSDGEPMWSLDTVAEHLFTIEPFEQLLGQQAMGTDDGR